MRSTVSMTVARKPTPLRIGIDLGGTKIEGVVMDEAGGERPRRRVPTPRDDYEATIEAIAKLVGDLVAEAGTSAATGACTVGIATNSRRQRATVSRYTPDTSACTTVRPMSR